jgi:ferritin-like metal-binding protein YciE
MSVNTFQDLLVNELEDLYSAENQITKALPKMAKAAGTTELRTAFETHLRQTEGQIKRLERVFEILGKSAKSKTCKGIRGIIDEGEENIHDTEGEVRDAAMIAGAQKVEHYEIAGYGSARTWAQQMGNSEIADLLQQTLNEEAETDKKLTQIAGKVNPKAQRHAA